MRWLTLLCALLLPSFATAADVTYTTSTVGAATATAASTVYAVAFDVDEPTVLESVSFNLSAASGSVAAVYGVWERTTTIQWTLVWSAPATVDSATLAFRVNTPGPPLELIAGKTYAVGYSYTGAIVVSEAIPEGSVVIGDPSWGTFEGGLSGPVAAPLVAPLAAGQSRDVRLVTDNDVDGDGIALANDGCPSSPPGFVSSPSTDLDGDGCQDATEDDDDDGDGVDAGVGPTLDCDDTNPAIRPGAPEACDAIDSDCDSSLVDGFPDFDGDGQPDCIDDDDDDDGLDDTPDDCDTSALSFTSNAAQDYDGDGCEDDAAEDPDDDNDGLDDGVDACRFSNDPTFTSTALTDFDQDGCEDDDPEDPDDDNDGRDDGEDDCRFSNDPTFVSTTLTDSDQDGCEDDDPEDPDDDNDGDPDLTDCRPFDATVFTGKAELCDGEDSNCDAGDDAEEQDGDGDGYVQCSPWSGTSPGVVGGGDCAPADPGRRPGVVELCDGLDNDCNGFDDFGNPGVDDQEGDADGDLSFACADCDDSPGTGLLASPYLAEVCDGLDNDCDGTADAAAAGGQATAFVGWSLVDSLSSPGAALADIAVPGTAGVVAPFPSGSASALPLGFDFPFGDTTYDTVYVHEDGLLMFSTPPTSPTFVADLPSPASPNGLLALWWADLEAGAGTVRTWSTASTFGVAVQDFEHSADATALVNARVLLDGATGGVRFAYDDLDGALGVAAIVAGIEGRFGSVGRALLNPSPASRQLSVPAGLLPVIVSVQPIYASEVDSDGDGELACADCDDSDPTSTSGGTEVCDGLDNNCDSVLPAEELDVDGDGVIECAGDCEPANPDVSPLTVELCNGIDDDCDLVIDDGFDLDGDGVTQCGGDGVPGNADDDCDDGESTVFPGNLEVCDGLDNDCDTVTPADEADDDEDGFVECEPWVGLPASIEGGDCDDNPTDPGDNATVLAAAARNPGQPELCDGIDNDCNLLDDFGSPGVGGQEADADADGSFACEDCDDADPLSSPELPELCDGVDNDCDGSVADEAADDDGDGVTPCGPDGVASPDDDCDDTNGASRPGLLEQCDGQDNDCDGTALDEFDDDDGDGVTPCGFDGVASEDDDCDDDNATIAPDALEACNGVDNDCDGAVPFYETDADFDGYVECNGWLSWGSPVLGGGDCDDDDPTIHPGRNEVCEIDTQVDTDCNGSPNSGTSGVLEGFVITVFVDDDQDGFGTGSGFAWCEQPGDCAENPGATCLSLAGGDCDDASPARHPEAPEVCNNLDDDCDNDADEPLDLDLEGSGCLDMYRDRDGDGVGDGTSSLCLCLLGGATELEYAGNRYVTISGDCDDENDEAFPTHFIGGFERSAAPEKLDGSDNDCDGLLPIVELDCDDDGSLALVPRPVLGNLTASAAELTACDPEAPQTLTCWDGDPLDLTCDERTGLWTLDYTESDDGFGGRLAQGRRVYATEPPCSANGDCDDLCPARCGGVLESCDGIDNDCSGTVTRDDGEGIPGSMKSEVAVGTIQIAEADLDLDGYLDCTGFDPAAPYEYARSAGSCAEQVLEPALIEDCNDACAWINPVATEVCDGFTNPCGGAGEGSDADGDGRGTCGVWGDATIEEPVLREIVAVPVWLANDPDANPSVIPLLLPRVGTPTEDTPAGATGPFASPELFCGDVGDVLSCDGPLAAWLTWLLQDTTPVPGESTDRLAELLAAAGLPLSDGVPGEARLDAGRRLVRDVCFQPRDADGSLSDDDPRGANARSGQCTLVVLDLSTDVDADFLPVFDPNLDGAADATAGGLPALSCGTNGAAQRDACTGWPEQIAARNIWTRERIIEARRSSAEWECMRMHPNRQSCADVREFDRLTLDWRERPDAAAAVAADPLFAAELGRFLVQAPPAGTVLACWGDLRGGVETLATDTGGDCADTGPQASSRHREVAEGPWDLRVGLESLVYGEDAISRDCAACLDGLDNNCDGTIDCEDPSCAPCFVGLGAGCAQGDSPCNPPGCGARVGGNLRAPAAGLTLLTLGLLGGIRVRSRRRAP